MARISVRTAEQARLPSIDQYPWDLLSFDSARAARIAEAVRQIAPKTSIKVLAQNLRETELRFFVPNSSVTDILSSARDRIGIQQYYFPKSLIPFFLRLGMELQGMPELPRSLREVSFTSARIRREQHPDGEKSYWLDIKGRKEGPKRARISRPVLGTEIDERLFKQLLPLATAGGIFKERHLVTRPVKYQGQTYSIIGEIDRVLRLGPIQDGQPRDDVSRSLDFVTVDLELGGSTLLGALRASRHSFDFLRRGAIEINSCERWLRDAFSNRRVAAKGYDKKLRQAAEELHTRANEENSAEVGRGKSKTSAA